MKLAFKKTGEGKPVFILHGLFGMLDNWMTLSRHFAENNFTCYAIDLRNHGRSPHSDEFSYTFMADDLAELMQDELLSSVHLIGHSMGGKAAMYFAGRYPAQTDKLIISDMATRSYPPQQKELAALGSIR